MPKGLGGVLVLGIVAGCAPATVQLARTNGKGNFQFGVEPGVIGAAGGDVTVLPSFNAAGRYGVTDRLDIGARLGTSVYELQFKAMVTDPAATDTLAISVAPSTTLVAAGIEGAGAGFVWNTRVPVLFGLPVGEGSELTVGPSGQVLLAGGGGAAGAVVLVGGQVGFAARTSDQFWLVPQLDLSYPVLAGAADDGESAVGIGGDGLLFGFQLGFLMGGPD